jgi:hypothetical protein
MLSEYPQAFTTPIFKPSRSSDYFSQTTCQDTIIIPYVKGISEKFKHIGNWFNVRTIFKINKHSVEH